MNTVLELVDRLRDTCESHGRCSVVEVMGRRAGHIALQTGLATGAVTILMPEIGGNVNDVIEKIEAARKKGKNHFVVMVAEGIGGVDEMAKQIEAATGIETRGTILGHIQRGGAPTLRDRVIASEMGFEAVNLLKEGIGNRVVAYKQGTLVNYDIYEALNMTKSYDEYMYLVATTTAI